MNSVYGPSWYSISEDAEKLRAAAAWIGARAGRYDAVGIALALALETWADELEVSREEGEGWEDTEIAMRAVLGADDARSVLQFLQARGWRPPDDGSWNWPGTPEAANEGDADV